MIRQKLQVKTAQELVRKTTLGTAVDMFDKTFAPVK